MLHVEGAGVLLMLIADVSGWVWLHYELLVESIQLALLGLDQIRWWIVALNFIKLSVCKHEGLVVLSDIDFI